MSDHIYLAHHGIKGMKWGVRRFRNEDGSLTSDGKRRYSQEQYKRDVSVYGRSGAKRIRRNVEKRGESVSGARSKEARRIKSARRRALIGGYVGAAAGSIGGSVGGVVGGIAVSRYVSNFLASKGGYGLDDPRVRMAVMAGVSTGMAKVGQTLGRDGGRAIGMISGGYSPSRYRNI